MPVNEPIDPDVDRPREPAGRGEAAVLAAVAVGGVLGAVARYEIGRAWPQPPSSFPWTTMWINTVGCALIGVLVVLVTETYTGTRLVRPFLGTGVLGGFTTFSTYAVDVHRLIDDGRPGRALLYLLATLLLALAAVGLATATTRWAVRR